MLDRRFDIHLRGGTKPDRAGIDALLGSIGLQSYSLDTYMAYTIGGEEDVTSVVTFVFVGDPTVEESGVAVYLAGKLAALWGIPFALVTCSPVTVALVDDKGSVTDMHPPAVAPGTSTEPPSVFVTPDNPNTVQ